ncbi:hydrogenase maturation nickel metallochaperone HypA [Elusimicrobiota bacterium]
MHELAIVQNMISEVEKSLCGMTVSSVIRVSIKVGEFSGVVPDSMQFAFEFAKEGTILENAALNIDQVAFKLRCRNCNKIFKMKDEFIYKCPHCDSTDAEVVSGKELFIESIEIEEE